MEASVGVAVPVGRLQFAIVVQLVTQTRSTRVLHDGPGVWILEILWVAADPNVAGPEFGETCHLIFP